MTKTEGQRVLIVEDQELWREQFFGESGYFDAADVGTRQMTGSRFTNDDGYTKLNHELRISTDPTKRVRGLV
ncbi:MAG: hypothetical protein AAF485_26450, partial [Chloroflexota bacterium]